MRGAGRGADRPGPRQLSESAEQLPARLADRHLLRTARDGVDGVPRYEFHELTWLYARERLEHNLSKAA
jgi:hypothetical protein